MAKRRVRAHRGLDDRGVGRRVAAGPVSALVNAGVDVRTISVYPIHHDFWGFSNS